MGVKEKLVKQAISHFSYGVSHDIFSEPVTTYAKLAIEALEKQIPKFPYDTVSCPLCKIEVELQPIDIEQVTYCLHCGQAIDWSDNG